jgi:radical SAM protein with 4Fe4S-binding SPASM domain
VDFKYALRTKPSFSTSFSSFSLFSQFNSCWFGKMAVTADGDVIPCIFARNQVAGNVNKQPLKTIIKSMSDKFWKITLDKVEVCQDCEYRFACHNCRPLAEGRFKNLLANNPRCSYNPYTGIWEI